MVDKQAVLKEVRAILERDPVVNVHRNPVRIDYQNGTVVLEGEVDHIAAKRRAQKLISTVGYVTAVDDRIRVKPSEYREDGAIRDSLIAALTQESAFHNCTVRTWLKQQFETVQDNHWGSPCHIDVTVERGVVTLSGEVISLSHKRLATVLAWWVPGSRDVIDQLQVVPDQSDSDDEITDAVQIALSKDPLVRGDDIRVRTSNRVVTLEGSVRGEAQRQMAEADVWYFNDVEQVRNRLACRP